MLACKHFQDREKVFNEFEKFINIDPQIHLPIPASQKAFYAND